MGILSRVSEALFSRSSRHFEDVMRSGRENYILGDGTGRFDDPDDRTKYLARKDDASPVESFSLGSNVLLDPWDGCPVVIAWEDGERCIVAMSRTGLKAQGINPNRYNTADTRLHGWTGKSSISDWSVQAIGTLANPSTKFVVQPNAAFDEAYQFKKYVRIQGDVASYIPGTGVQRLLMVAVKPDYSLHYATSTTQSIATAFDETDIQECLNANFPRAVPVVFFALGDDQDRLVEPDIYMDGRMLWNLMPPRMNWTATTDPTDDDDLGIGYGTGSRWINTTSGTEFVCVDDTEGDAEWIETTTTTPTAGSITLTMFASTTLHVTTTAPTITDDSDDGYGVGSVWINTTTGRVYVLVDSAVGAAQWAEVTNVDVGTVTSVGLSLPAIFNVTGSPVTTSGTLTATLVAQTANTILAGPATGSSAAPAFRGLVSDDIPNLDAAKMTTGVFDVARIPNLPASIITSGLLALARGGTNADLSASGGTGQFVKQLTSGGALSVGVISASELPTIPIAGGGTGQTTKTEGFDALSPTTTQGDIIYHDGTDNVRLAKGTALQYLRMNAGATAPEWAAGMTIDWQAFTTPGAATWTKPARCVFVDVICVGAGGGGGGGRRSTATSVRVGGGGGAGGSVVRMQWAASQLGASESLDVGTGGIGGAAPAVDNTNGGVGGTGGPSFFGGTNSGNAKLIAQGGNGGTGGGNNTAGIGGAGQTTLSNTYQFYNVGGGDGGRDGTPIPPVNAQWGPGGGGGGGGINTTGTAFNAAAGASASRPAYGGAVQGGGGAAGTTGGGGTGGVGTAGTTNGTSAFVFGAGGGGGAPVSNIGQSGGNGGLPGGGGGGAGATLNGNSGFPGGFGGDGAVYVISYCY